MMTYEPRPFTASTSKLAYAQAFSRSTRRNTEHRSLLRRLTVRRDRSRTA